MGDGVSLPSRDDCFAGRVGSPASQPAAAAQSRPPLRVDRDAVLHVIGALVTSPIHLEHFVVVVECEMRSFERGIFE